MIEPERELVRRVLPLALPAVALAFAVGAVVDGPGAGASAALGVAVVLGNFFAYAVSIGWAARISITAVFAAGLGGYLVRIAVIVALLVGLNTLPWFSAVAFVLAVVPATVLLLGFEMKVLSGRAQADMWRFPSEGAR
jgi:hypothetical protein